MEGDITFLSIENGKKAFYIIHLMNPHDLYDTSFSGHYIKYTLNGGPDLDTKFNSASSF